MKVNEILANLKNGILTVDTQKQPTKKKLLQARLAKLKLKLDDLIKHIGVIKETDTYKTATENEDWDIYFEKVKAKLQKEIEILTI